MSFGLLAHAAPISYKFPLPIWLYALAGGIAVLASAPAAAVAVQAAQERGWRSRDLYPVLRRLRLGPIGLALCTILFVWGLAGGFGARTAEGHEFFENPLTVLVWVDFWVGLGVVSALVGNAWDFVSPVNAAARALDRALARRNVAPLAYPARLGRWPAFVLLLVWSWAELVWEPAKTPDSLALIAVLYVLATLLGTLVFGAEAWLDKVELFTVFARTFARFAPLELEPRNPDRFLAEPPEERHVRLRAYGAGLRADEPLPAGGGAFVLATLATVVFDGFSQTTRYADFRAWVEGQASWFSSHQDLFGTLMMLAIVGAFILAFVVVAGLLSGSPAEAARLYSPTLVPIAAVYFIAHYFVYLLFVGQLTLGVLVDPFGKSWNPGGLGEYGIWRGIISAGAAWWIQVVLIVWGHVAAVFAAHRVAVERQRPKRALVAQAPLVLLMVGYTMAGLWVLAQQIAAAGG